jgi:XRE family transcriptional regulator, aerobic/anaerobic benzoate catabolism transcriptional regulator
MATAPADAALLSTLGRRVRAAREARGWTRRRAAEEAGLSDRFLAEVEAGRGNISVARLARLASAIGVRTSDLVAEPAPRRVALLGLRGAGKSTVGRLLAKRLGVPFLELDALVEEAAGLPLRELFAVHGEAYFRRLEREALERVLQGGEPAVLAVGGSLVNDPETFGRLRAAATTVWLRARPEDHMRRVREQGDLRPMAARSDAMAELKAILAARAPLYAQADVVVDTTHATAARVAERVATELAPAVTATSRGPS